MFGSAFRNAGRAFVNANPSARRRLSIFAWSNERDLIFGADEIGVADIGAALGAIGGGWYLSSRFCKLGDNPTEKALGSVAGGVMGCIGGATMGVIVTTPVFVFTACTFTLMAVASGDDRHRKQNDQDAAENKDSGKSR